MHSNAGYRNTTHSWHSSLIFNRSIFNMIQHGDKGQRRATRGLQQVFWVWSRFDFFELEIGFQEATLQAQQGGVETPIVFHVHEGLQ